MSMRHYLCALVVLSTVPSLAGSDIRVRSVPFQEDVVTTIAGRQGFESNILFDNDEKIENVAVGDSLAWQVTPNKRANVLFVKPLLANGRTNMTVVTDRHVYFFDLIPSSPEHTMLYTLRYVYPSEPTHKVEPAAPQTFNFNWKAKGSAKVIPAHIFDDGQSVYLRWDSAASMPAILAVAADGTESVVNYVMNGDTVKIDGMPQKLALRSGNESATLTHAAPPPPPIKLSDLRKEQ